MSDNIIQIEFKDDAFKTYKKKLRERTVNLRPAMMMGTLFMKKQTDLTFENLAHGGKSRSVRWKKFSPKTRYRHSGKKVTEASMLLQDHGLTRRSIQADVGHDEFTLTAKRQHSAAINEWDRKFLFVSKNDNKKLARVAITYINTGKLKVPAYGT